MQGQGTKTVRPSDGRTQGEVRSVERPAVETATLFRDGDYWTVAYGGRVARIRHMKGFEHIRTLLGDPDRSFSAADLAGEAGGQGEADDRRRLRVTKAIRAATRRIASYDSALGELLDSSIRTGWLCAYVPPVRHPVVWRL